MVGARKRRKPVDIPQNLFEYLDRQKPRTFLDAFRANNDGGIVFNNWSKILSKLGASTAKG